MERSAALNKDLGSTAGAAERGAALFLALFALTAIGFVSLRLVTRAAGYSRLLNVVRDGLEHNAALRESITPIRSPKHQCDLQRLNGGNIAGISARSSPWHVCTTGQPEFLSNRPLAVPYTSPDYGAIFERHTPCVYRRSATTLRSFNAPTAPFNCLLPPDIRGEAILLDNIAIETLTISPKNSSDTITVATPGSLISSTNLAVSTDTIILAGGDIRISTLGLVKSPLAVPSAQVTIISAHGDVVIERIDGALSLLVLGRRIIAVPETNTPNSAQLPATRFTSIAGFEPQ